MRVPCHLLLLLVCIATARPQDAKPPTAGERYLSQVTATLENAMTAQFGRRLYKMGNAKLTFRLRIARDGRISEFKALSSTHDEALEQAAVHCLEHVRCPPVPSELLFPSDDALEIQIDMARQEDLNALGQAYATQATNVARQLLVAEFSKYPERIHHLSITFTFQVDAGGRPHNVKIASKTPDAWAEDTSRRALSAAKFPPIPEEIVQTGSDLANIGGDFSADAP